MPEERGDSRQVTCAFQQLCTRVFPGGVEATPGHTGLGEGIFHGVDSVLDSTVTEGLQVGGSAAALAVLVVLMGFTARAIEGAVLRGGLDEAGTHGDGAALAPLTGHAESPARQVEVGPGEGKGLSDAQAGVGSEQQEETIVGGGMLKYALNVLLGIGRTLL